LAAPLELSAAPKGSVAPRLRTTDLDYPDPIKMIIFVSIWTTFEASIILEAAEAEVKIGLGLKTNFNFNYTFLRIPN
jgi:hypothetical protein